MHTQNKEKISLLNIRVKPEQRKVMERAAIATGKSISDFVCDALARTIPAADIAGIRAIAVHAISQEAKRFYQYCGFHESSSEPMTLMAALAEIQAAF